MEENWTYDDGDFNEDLPYVELQFGIDDLYMIYQSVAFKYEKWLRRSSMTNRKDLHI